MQKSKQKTAIIIWEDSLSGDRTYLLNGGSLESILEARSNDFGISYEELVKLINQVVKTGEVHDGGNFSLYYDYEGRGIRTSGISY